MLKTFAGTYLPNIAHVISQHNNHLLSLAPAARPLPVLNFKSVLIGNGLSQPEIQFGSVPEYACDSKYAVFDDPEGAECTKLRADMKRCQSLTQACFK